MQAQEGARAVEPSRPEAMIRLIQAYKKVHFLGPDDQVHKPGAQIESGARSLDDIARFLRYAVDICGMPKRCLPPDPK